MEGGGGPILRSKFMGDNTKSVGLLPHLAGPEELEELTGDYVFASPNGFYFQERRGVLNLRQLARVDVPKLIREVDVDLLNTLMENITFCNLREEDLRYLTDPQVIKMFKISQCTIEYLLYSQDKLVSVLGATSKKYWAKKKALQKKRQEIAELEENNKHLRHQVRAKRQNINTLEDLLRETSKARESEFKHMKESMKKSLSSNNNNKENNQPQRNPSVVSFFVSDTGGICIEFSEHVDMKISSLIAECRKAFVSKRDDECTIKLLHNGKLLLPNQTLSSSNVGHRDTIIVVKEVLVKEPEPPKPEIVRAVAEPNQDLEKMIAYLHDQQDSINSFTKEVKAGWETALKTLAEARTDNNSNNNSNRGPSQVDVLEKMEFKLSALESNLKENINIKLEGFQNMISLYASESERERERERPQNVVQVSKRRGVEAGDLEDDDETNRMEDLDKQLRSSLTKIYNLESENTHTKTAVYQLSEALRLQNLQMETIKGSLHTHPVEVIHHHPAPKPEPVLAALPAPEVIVREEPPPKPKPLPVMSTVQQPEPKISAPVVVVPPPKPKMITDATIVFPLRFNPDLKKALDADFVITLPLSTTPDDVVFEIRKLVAFEVKAPIGRVALHYDNRPIGVLGLDTDADFLKVESVAKDAPVGTITITITGSTILTNDQIDLFTSSWEKHMHTSAVPTGKDVFKKSSRGITSDTSGNDSDTSQGKQSRFKSHKQRVAKQGVAPRRSWDDDTLDGPEGSLEPGTGAIARASAKASQSQKGLLEGKDYKYVMSSLDKTLSDVSDKEGLTDDELQKKLESLHGVTEKVPVDVALRLGAAKQDISSSVVGASLSYADSSDNDASKAKKKKSGFGKAMSIAMKLVGVSASGKSSPNNAMIVGATGAATPVSADNTDKKSTPSTNGSGRSDSTTRSVGSNGHEVNLRRSVEAYSEEEDAPMMASVKKQSIEAASRRNPSNNKNYNNNNYYNNNTTNNNDSDSQELDYLALRDDFPFDTSTSMAQSGTLSNMSGLAGSSGGLPYSPNDASRDDGNNYRSDPFQVTGSTIGDLDADVDVYANANADADAIAYVDAKGSGRPYSSQPRPKDSSRYNDSKSEPKSSSQPRPQQQQKQQLQQKQQQQKQQYEPSAVASFSSLATPVEPMGEDPDDDPAVQPKFGGGAGAGAPPPNATTPPPKPAHSSTHTLSSAQRRNQQDQDRAYPRDKDSGSTPTPARPASSESDSKAGSQSSTSKGSLFKGLAGSERSQDNNTNTSLLSDDEGDGRSDDENSLELSDSHNFDSLKE